MISARNRIGFLAPAVALCLVLSGCQGGSPEASGANDASQSATIKLLSDTWQATKPDAASIAEDLVEAGVCSQIDRNESGSYAGDMLTRFKNGNFIFCRNWPDSVTDPAKLDCAAEIFITTGSKNLFDPKRSLIYEDGLSVALYYADSYQVELSPLLGAMLSTKQIIKACKPAVDTADSAIGGSVSYLSE